MADCPFCNGSVIKPDSVNGNPTMLMAINNLLSVFGYEPKHEDKLSLGIQLQHGNRLCWDSSAQEYAVLEVEIRYCPFCRRELVRKI